MPVIAVTEDQVPDVIGQLSNVFEITYTLPDRPGVFTVTVPRQADAVAAAEAEIASLAAQVGGIYAIP